MVNYQMKVSGLYIELTTLCHQNCSYCYNNGSAHSLSEKIIFSLIDNLYEGAECTFSGGEPFLYPYLNEILLYCNQKNIVVDIITSGTIFPDNKLMDTIIKVQPNIQLTFDAATPNVHDITRGEGSFNSMIEFLREIRKNGWMGILYLRANFFKGSVDRIPSLIKLATELQAAKLFISPIFPTGKGLNFENIYNSLYEVEHDIKLCKENYQTITVENCVNVVFDYCKNSGCPFCFYQDSIVNTVLRIAANGNVYPCQALSGDEFILGNIVNDPLLIIVKSEKVNQFLEFMRLRNEYMPKCKECIIQSICKRGCPGKGYLFAEKNIMEPGLNCRDAKKDYINQIRQYIGEKK